MRDALTCEMRPGVVCVWHPEQAAGHLMTRRSTCDSSRETPPARAVSRRVAETKRSVDFFTSFDLGVFINC